MQGLLSALLTLARWGITHGEPDAALEAVDAAMAHLYHRPSASTPRCPCCGQSVGA